MPFSVFGKTFAFVQRSARRALPRDWLLLQELREQVELLLEQHLVVAQVVAEERERFDERAATEDHLGAAVRDGIQRREPLVEPNRVVA